MNDLFSTDTGSYRLRKKLILAMVVSIVICITAALALYTIPRAYAQGDAATIGEETLALQLTHEMAKVSESILDSTKEKLDEIDNIREDARFNTLWTLFQALAIALLASYFIIRIIRDLQKEEATAEFWVRIGMTFTLALILLTNLDWIFNSLDTMGLAIRDAVTNAINGINQSYESAYYNSVSDMFVNTLKDVIGSDSINMDVSGTWEQASSIMVKASENTSLLSIVSYALGSGELMLIKGLSISVRFALNGVIYFVGINFVIRRTFAPLAIAHIMMEGSKSPGTRYLKRYAALYLQEAMLYIVACVGTYIAAIVMQGANIKLYVMWSIMGAIVIVMGSTGRFARELLNAE